jgi:cyclophilin family peptidyl-prolyl cis-trans isomerase/HEAT repeat protein
LQVPTLRPIAIRAIGRLERPDLIGHIIPFLSDPGLSGLTANALAQSTMGLVGRPNRGPHDRALVDSVFRLLLERALKQSDWVAKGDIARSIGRLPYDDARQARAADSALVALVSPDPERIDATPALAGTAHGLYSLARARRTLGDLSPAAVAWLRRAAVFTSGQKSDVSVRRPAWLALNAAGVSDRNSVAAGAGDPDPQVRRLAVAAMPNVNDSAFQRMGLERAAVDHDPMVRLEWVRVYRQLIAASGCRPLLAATQDSVHHVRLAAIDALGGPCPERDTVIAVLTRTIESGPAGPVSREGYDVSWHARAHALVALARVDSTIARPLLRRDGRHPVWQVRMYAARGAVAMRDTVLLTSLAFDSVGSVREVAIMGLSNSLGHLADLVYVRALSSRDYHVVLAAARALRGAPATDSVRPAVVSALMRLTREQRQTSRDPRMELLARLRDVGDRGDVDQLRRLLSDTDEVVAAGAASVIGTLTGSAVAATPRRVPRVVTPPTGQVRVRITMSASSGGGVITLVLDADEAPMTVARIIELIRNRYYDGLTFHRVVPNFVLQGGSPGMNEYVGDGPFMRDELSLAHHARGTVGISTRGRDTGDAQWFINLVDNYRLNHDYTVFAEIVGGMDVVDRILEGDVIQAVRVITN